MVGMILFNELFNAFLSSGSRAVRYNQVPTSAGETGMEIAIQSSDELEQVRTRLRKMTDAQLVSFGKAARVCAETRDVLRCSNSN